MKTVENENHSLESEFVVLEGVPWETYEGILDALGEYHLRHTYDGGALEMRRVLYGVAWEDYVKLLDATPDFYLRHTYDEGALEMMSPPSTHHWVARLVARMIEAYALASDTPIESVGSMTLQASRSLHPMIRDHARDLRHNATLPEQLLWSVLRGRRLGGLKFRRQEPIDQYIVDFCCRELKLVVELDGSSHEDKLLADAARSQYLIDQGYRVLRVTNNDVMQEQDAVARYIAKEAGVEWDG